MPEPVSRYIVVDTDVFVWLVRGRDTAAKYAELVEGARIVLFFATVAELWRGAYVKGYNDNSCRRLDADIRGCVVVPPSNDLTHAWARLTAQARTMGHALGQKAQTHDAWIAATALQYDLALLTDDHGFQGYPQLRLLQ